VASLEIEVEKAKLNGAKRSAEWPKVRAVHLLKEPACGLCGGTDKVEVHHVRPFHIHPELELDPMNLITLCEANKEGFDCHLAFGHLGSFKSWNVSVIADCINWSVKLHNRPLEEV
jgi:5-methylcytosine-specific restriction protein A